MVGKILEINSQIEKTRSNVARGLLKKLKTNTIESNRLTLITLEKQKEYYGVFTLKTE